MATIMLVDDDVDLVKTCEMAIAQHGHEIKTALSAKDARELLKLEQPDIIVMDVMMETKTAGIDLAQEVRRLYPDLPIIMLTSIHEAVPPSMHFEADETWLPVVKFLDKPVDPLALADEIDAVLEKK